jgi:hypothetical protein
MNINGKAYHLATVYNSIYQTQLANGKSNFSASASAVWLLIKQSIKQLPGFSTQNKTIMKCLQNVAFLKDIANKKDLTSFF